jgi:hypothetical protein
VRDPSKPIASLKFLRSLTQQQWYERKNPSAFSIPLREKYADCVSPKIKEKN